MYSVLLYMSGREVSNYYVHNLQYKFPDKTIPRQFIAEVKLSKKSKKYYGNGEFVITARYEHELLHKLGNYLLAETEWLHHSDQEE